MIFLKYQKNLLNYDFERIGGYMTKNTELSLFQKNMNYLTFYLYLMNTKCKYLQDYDDEGDFENHNSFFSLCYEKLKHKIQNDEYLLLNNSDYPFINHFFTKLKDNKEKIIINNKKLTKDEKRFLYETYFEYSKTLSKSKFRNKAHNCFAWGIVGLLISLFILLPILSFTISNKFTIKELIYPYTIFFCLFMVSGYYFIYGIILFFEIRNKKMDKTKFHFMYSNDYCYKRIKECEAFFRNNYNVENEILEINEIEKKFPEKQNFFYQTIMETQMDQKNFDKILKINANLYCRAVLSDFLKSIKENGIDEIQQIAFVFVTCKSKAKVDIVGNTAFSMCVSHIFGSPDYTPEKFNSSIQKLTNPKTEIFPKYLAILEKYENILQ